MEKGNGWNGTAIFVGRGAGIVVRDGGLDVEDKLNDAEDALDEEAEEVGAKEVEEMFWRGAGTGMSAFLDG